MLEVSNLVLKYGLHAIVRGVSFSAQEGQVFAILGPNGAGKSSVFKAMTGSLRPVSGDIRFLDRSLVGLNPGEIVRLGISRVPEGRRIFPEMSVFDNLMLGATPHIGNRGRVAELLGRCYELFPLLRDRAKQRGGTLSGGEQQQLTIARGLMADPKLLLIDEPTLGLAPTVIQALADTFPRLREFGLTIIIAEQNADFALKTAEAGIVLTSGEVSLRGDAEVLRRTEEVQRAYLGA